VASSAAANAPGKPQYITPGVVSTPGLALVDAAREVLRIVDLLENMLHTFLEILKNDDRKLLSRLAAMDDAVDTLHNG
jgi:phosphate:Na+ symporter